MASTLMVPVIPAPPRPFRPVYTVVIDRDEVDGIARINGVPQFTGRGGMHVRGQSSSGFPKKQYAWETWNNENEDKNVSILGMPRESDWILYAPYSDKALMRNAIVYETAREAQGNFGGVRTRYVEVFFNSNGGTVSMNDYRGIYVVMEKIKRDRERVDVERLGDLTTDPNLITGGYIFKKDKGPYSSPWNTAIEGVPLDMHYPESPNSAQFDYLRGYINDMEAALHSSDFADPEIGYQAFIDRESFIDAHLFTEAFKDIDGYRISTYFSKSRDGKIRALPVWDFNLGLGNANYLQGENPIGWYYPQVSSPNYYWYQRLFFDGEFDLAYWDRFWEFRRKLLSNDTMMAMIDRHDAELDGANGAPNAVTRNFAEWNILGSYVWPNAGGYQSRTTHQAEVDWMKNWLTQRLAWMETQSRGTNGLARPPSFNLYGGQVNAGFDLTMSEPNDWANAKIYYTLDGSDPRLGPSPSVTLISEDAPCEVLIPSITNGGSSLSIAQWTNPAAPPNAVNWTAGTQGVGYERSSNNLYDPYFDLDVEAEMANQNQTCYIRIPFTIASQAELDALGSLVLRMRYDDSFVAYLNGVEVVREANAPAILNYNSGAEGSHDDNSAINYLEFAVSGGNANLQVGQNM
ncbi:CotH kinase family protein, partial [Akkermansiaceae bacterium]|nr:CotH kinase family protein [Akkermansiaceae bacterium]